MLRVTPEDPAGSAYGMSLLLTPWFWVGLAAVVAAFTLGWFAGHSRPAPTASARLGARPETKHDHAEFVDDLR